jgi:hypothetical protein
VLPHHAPEPSMRVIDVADAVRRGQIERHLDGFEGRIGMLAANRQAERARRLGRRSDRPSLGSHEYVPTRGPTRPMPCRPALGSQGERTCCAPTLAFSFPGPILGVRVCRFMGPLQLARSYNRQDMLQEMHPTEIQ